MLKLDDQTFVHLISQITCTLLLRAPAETVECASRTVEDGGGEHLWSGCGAKHVQSTKCIPLTTPHKALELTKLQAASYVRVRSTWPLELAQETELRRKIVFFVVVFESLCGATVTLFERLDGKTPVLDAHPRELITIITQRYLSVLRFCRWS